VKPFAIFLLCTVLGQAAQKNYSEIAWETLQLGVTEGNVNKRKLAVASLDVAGLEPRAVHAAEEALKDTSVEVRESAAAALGNMQSRRSIPLLRKALDDDAPEVSFTAAHALWKMGDTSGREIMQAVLAGERGDSSGILKTSFRGAKSTMHNPKALAMLGLKEGAGAFLGPFAMGIYVVEELRKDASATARTIAAEMLSQDKTPATIKNLEEALDDKNWVVRAAAAKALARRGSRASIPKIGALLDDKADGARYVAAASILRLSGTGRRTTSPKKQ
jgi:HEAT repeat protein